jgi:hypothetical protein
VDHKTDRLCISAMGLTMTQVIHAVLFCAYDRISTPRLRLQCRVHVVMSTLPLVRAFSFPRSYTITYSTHLPRMYFVYRKHTSSVPGPYYDGAWLDECIRTLRPVALKNTIVSAISGVVEYHHWSIDIPSPLANRLVYMTQVATCPLLLNQTCESAYLRSSMGTYYRSASETSSTRSQKVATTFTSSLSVP